VFGLRSRHLQADVPNRYVAECVAQNSPGMIGIAAADPTDRDCLLDVEDNLQRPEFRGVVVSPAWQDFHPADSRAMRLYGLLAEVKAPVFFLNTMHYPAAAKMEYARPYLLDEIAREFPTLTMVITGLGYPWVDETVTLLGKHPRVFADISGLLRRPWLAYSALLAAHQAMVMDKVLFSSDFPFLTAAEAIEALYRLHEVTQHTNLPTIPRESLRAMTERNSLQALSIARAGDSLK
jgi:predicted TIM-barrel fold metal-dependent hydrolase